jgi:hypothetical protein
MLMYNRKRQSTQFDGLSEKKQENPGGQCKLQLVFLHIRFFCSHKNHISTYLPG